MLHTLMGMEPSKTIKGEVYLTGLWRKKIPPGALSTGVRKGVHKTR